MEKKQHAQTLNTEQLHTELNVNDQYSIRLLDKVEQLNGATKNKADLDIINKAIIYAKKYHGNQMRKSGEPFYSTP